MTAITVRVIYDSQTFYVQGRDRYLYCDEVDVIGYVWISRVMGTYADDEEVSFGQELTEGDLRGMKVLKVFNRFENAYWYLADSRERIKTDCATKEQGPAGPAGPAGPVGPEAGYHTRVLTAGLVHVLNTSDHGLTKIRGVTVLTPSRGEMEVYTEIRPGAQVYIESLINLNEHILIIY